MKKILDVLGGNLITGVSNIVDKFVSTTEEKEKAKKELIEVISTSFNAEQNQLTERLKADNNTDVKLTKLIRPIMLIVFFALFSILTLLNAFFKISVDKEYLEIIKLCNELSIGFYFGSRGVEKTINFVSTNYKKSKNDRNNL